MTDAKFLKQFQFQDCDIVQVWQENGNRQPGVDLFLGEDLVVDGDALYINDVQVGQAEISVDIDGIGMINWTGQGTSFDSSTTAPVFIAKGFERTERARANVNQN